MTPAPTQCPVCGSAVTEHVPETKNEYEAWEFDCNAVILRYENGKLSAESDCARATRQAVAKLNEAYALISTNCETPQ